MTNPEKYEELQNLIYQISIAPIDARLAAELQDKIYAAEMHHIRKEWAESVLKKEAKV